MNVAEWLSSLPNIENVKRCRVTIGRDSYDAASYIRTLSVPEGSPAWQRGRRTYTQESVLCIGMLPSSYRRSRRAAFTRADDPREWYIGAYAGPVHDRRQETQTPNEHHPFGNTFILFPWEPQGAIDMHEPHPYRRVALIVEYPSPGN